MTGCEMGCTTSKSTKTSYQSIDNKKGESKPHRPSWYNRDWDSVTDSQINTTSTYLDRTGASTCSLKGEGGKQEAGVREAGDGREETDSTGEKFDRMEETEHAGKPCKDTATTGGDTKVQWDLVT